jgi:hypothetical protein
MKIKNILVISCGPWDYGTLQRKEFNDRYHFFFEDITTEPRNINDFISYIINKYQDRHVEGVLGTHDGPESLVAAILAKEFGLYGPEPAIAFVCEHKYYSREAQKKIVPAAIPEYQLLSINGLKREDLTLSFPIFVKPVKSAFSILAKPISNFESLEAFLPRVRKRLSQSIPAFNILIKKYTTLDLDGNLLIAEQILEGVQVTVEGFSWNKKVTMMGITDSIMYPGTMSFERFEYPSKLPLPVQQRMTDIAGEVISEMGLDYIAFNIEMFYNPEKDTIKIIEINPRMSYQFADMYEKVDGTNSYAIQLQLSLGEQPGFQKGEGHFGVAASFVLRLFENKQVVRIPTQEEVRIIHNQFPDSFIIIKVEEGMLLSDVSQDESSFRYAIINLGGKDWTDLYTRFAELKKQLRFEFEALPGEFEYEEHELITQVKEIS